MRALLRFVALAAGTSCSTALLAGALLIPTTAPEWETSGWLNDNPGPLSAMRGKVVLIEFFQVWCPVCNSFSVPLFQHWDELYGKRDDVRIVSIHTVFEGHDVQTVKRLREFVKEKDIRHPVGIDAYTSPEGTIPVSMKRFKTEGTPQIAIVDKAGMLRWSHFGKFDPVPVEAFIERLLVEKADAAAVQTAASQPKETRKKPPRGARAGAGAGAPKREGGPGARRRPPRDAPPEPDPEPDRDPDPEPEAEEEPEPAQEPEVDVSGKYRLTFELATNTCGEGAPAQTVFADLVADDGRLQVSFSRRYLGQQQLSLDYDTASGTFHTQASSQGEEEGTEVTLNISVTGHFVEGAMTPELQFEFQFEKTGATAETSCVIAGSGSGGKAGA